MSVQLVVFDVDGTLYDQRKLRALMAAEILLFVALHPWRWRDVLVVREYRNVHEAFSSDECANLEQALVSEVARRMSVPQTRVSEIIQEWLFERPLKHLPSVRFHEVATVIEELKASGVRVAFLSDHYPVGKLKALSLDSGAAYYSTRSDLSCLKPNPKLLLTILTEQGARPGECVVVGDRDDRDGEIARRTGVHFVRFPDDKVVDGLLDRIRRAASGAVTH